MCRHLTTSRPTTVSRPIPFESVSYSELWYALAGSSIYHCILFAQKRGTELCTVQCLPSIYKARCRTHRKISLFSRELPVLGASLPAEFRRERISIEIDCKLTAPEGERALCKLNVFSKERIFRQSFCIVCCPGNGNCERACAAIYFFHKTSIVFRPLRRICGGGRCGGQQFRYWWLHSTSFGECWNEYLTSCISSNKRGLSFR